MTFRNGNIFLTCDGIGMWSNIPVLMVGRSGEAIKCITGTHEILLEKEKLYPHGIVRKVKTYKTLQHNEFARFEVNFGEDEFIVDVKVSDFCFKIEDLRVRAFAQALEKRAA